MDTDSAAATIWAYFYGWYVAEVFNPWWKSRAVKVDIGEVSDALEQDLEAWTLHDPGNRAFSAPGVGSRTAADAQRAAFHKMIPQIAKTLGSDPSSWTWGRVHGRVLENLADISGLNYGPLAERGDGRTPLAAGGYPSTHGPSWRMVVDWGSHTFAGVYPGGQSENPASAWYTDRADAWWGGELRPMLSAEEAGSAGGTLRWSMRP
jgi:penicillin amidase